VSDRAQVAALWSKIPRELRNVDILGELTYDESEGWDVSQQADSADLAFFLHHRSFFFAPVRGHWAVNNAGGAHAHGLHLQRSLSSRVPLVARASCTSAGSRIPSPPRLRPAPARGHRLPRASARRARRHPGHPSWGESWHGRRVPDPLSAPVLNQHWHRYVATNAHRLPPAALPVTPGGHPSCRARAGRAARRRSALAYAPVGSEMSHASGGTATACWS
jgi:hypothetical protein